MRKLLQKLFKTKKNKPILYFSERVLNEVVRVIRVYKVEGNHLIQLNEIHALNDTYGIPYESDEELILEWLSETNQLTDVTLTLI